MNQSVNLNKLNEFEIASEGVFVEYKKLSN